MASRIGVKLYSDMCVACSQAIDLQRFNIHPKSPRWNQSYLFGSSAVQRERGRKQQLTHSPFTLRHKLFEAVIILA